MCKSLLIFTEGSPEIGLGHLVECQAIVDSCRSHHGLKEYFFLVYGDSSAVNFLDRKGLPFRVVANNYLPLSRVVEKYDAVLVNKKHVEYKFLKTLKQLSKKLVVIDELGGKEIAADVLINFSINTKRHNYTFPDGKPITLFGPEYFPTTKTVIEALTVPKPKESKTIIVSMGGYDNSRITDKVLAALMNYPDFQKEVILGPGFKQGKVFKELKKSLDNTFIFLKNINDLPSRIRKASFLVNSGGNTLYEAAILKTPVLVIGEDSHEIEQGKKFEKKGWAINVNEGKKANIRTIIDAIDIMKSKDFSFSNVFQLKQWYKLFEDKN